MMDMVHAACTQHTRMALQDFITFVCGGGEAKHWKSKISTIENLHRAFLGFLMAREVHPVSRKNGRLLPLLYDMLQFEGYTTSTVKRLRRCARVLGPKMMHNSRGIVSNDMRLEVRGQLLNVEEAIHKVQLDVCDTFLNERMKNTCILMLKLNGQTTLQCNVLIALITAINELSVTGIQILHDLEPEHLQQRIDHLGQKHRWNNTILNGLRALVKRCLTSDRCCLESRSSSSSIYRTHALYVPWSFLERYTILKQFPGVLARRLHQWFSATDIDFFINHILKPLMQHRLLSIGAKRIPERALASLSKQSMCVLRMLRNTFEIPRAPPSIRAMLTGEYAHITNAVAQTIARENFNRNQNPHRRGSRSSAVVSTRPHEFLLTYFKKCMFLGAF